MMRMLMMMMTMTIDDDDDDDECDGNVSRVVCDYFSSIDVSSKHRGGSPSVDMCRNCSYYLRLFVFSATSLLQLGTKVPTPTPSLNQ